MRFPAATAAVPCCHMLCCLDHSYPRNASLQDLPVACSPLQQRGQKSKTRSSWNLRTRPAATQADKVDGCGRRTVRADREDRPRQHTQAPPGTEVTK